METKRIEDKEDVNKIKVKRPDLIIRTDYKLWEYLFKDQQKKAKKLTKAEAYYDLIKKLPKDVQASTLKTLFGKESIQSASELAKHIDEYNSWARGNNVRVITR